MSNKDRWALYLSLVGAGDDITTTQLALVLQSAFVGEILGKRRQEYEAFTAH